MLCSNVLNVLMKLRAIPPSYLASHSIKQKGKKKIRERKKGSEVGRGGVGKGIQEGGRERLV